MFRIPLVSSVAVQFYEKEGKSLPYSFNRKEAKDHGEGGSIVGSPLNGKILIIDDVITAGTAIRESLDVIGKNSTTAHAAGVVIALDRQEKGVGERSAIEEIKQDLKLPVVCIITLEDIIEYLTIKGGYETHLEEIRKYRETYGINK